MRRLLLLAAVAAGGVLGSSGAARADGGFCGPYATSVTWPSAVPPGWYTNTYWHGWFYPWYAYYNFSHGPYADWMSSGGRAGYANHGPAGLYHFHKPPAEPYLGAWYTGGGSHAAPVVPGTPAVPAAPKTDEKPKDKPKEGDKGTVAVTLPSDAKLLFNGVAANGTGLVRTFQTPALEPGRDYKYELEAEVMRDGHLQRATGTVIVRAGETATVALTPIPVVAASK
jgi:uncharacterized protein (TIGR03000 family)